MKKSVKYISLAILFVSLGYFSMQLLSFRLENSRTKETSAIVSNENTAGRILGEEENQVPSRMFASEGFRAPMISFGGEAMVLPSGEQAEVPEITNLKSELLMTKSDQKVKFVLNWRTNKPCLSSIGFKKEGAAQGKIVSEDGYGYIHSAVLAPLNFSTAYSYTVAAKDKWGNVAQADKLAFYTGAPNVSVFDLLGSAFKDMFGR